MNRRDFLQQLGADLWATAREVVSPFVKKDLEKLETLADSFAGFAFYRLEGGIDAPQGSFGEKRIGNEPVLLLQEGELLHAYSGKCPSCGQLLQMLPHQRAFRCFACETQIAFAERERLTAFPVKRRDGCVFVGIPRR